MPIVNNDNGQDGDIGGGNRKKSHGSHISHSCNPVFCSNWTLAIVVLTKKKKIQRLKKIEGPRPA